VAKVLPLETNYGLPISLSPFRKIAVAGLDELRSAGPIRHISLSAMLQVCASVFELAAVHGRAHSTELPRLVRRLVVSDDAECTLPYLKWSVRSRLEKTGRECKSLPTFYLCRTTRSMAIDFNVEGMRQAHHIPMMPAETWTHIDRAASEGLAIGAWYPDLTKHLFNRKFNSKHPVIIEMLSQGSVSALCSEDCDIEDTAERIEALLTTIQTGAAVSDCGRG
jgi:hypothetical protein